MGNPYLERKMQDMFAENVVSLVPLYVNGIVVIYKKAQMA
jgi:hypothetical protein